MRAALLALALGVSPVVVPEPLRAPMVRLNAIEKPSVANVREALKAMRDFESAARPLLARGEDTQLVHSLLAHGWERVEGLETALHIDGEGEGPEREAVRSMAEARARDAHALRTWEENAPHKLAEREGLEACWQEHLLSTSKADAVDAVAILSLQKGRVVAVEFKPALDGPRAHLGECLTTRLLDASGPVDADAVELPLRFTSPRRAN